MASRTHKTSDILCRAPLPQGQGGWPGADCYYMHGACNKGSSCSFSHDRQSNLSTVCKYYQNGHCVYGSRCRYDHIRPKSFERKTGNDSCGDPCSSSSSDACAFSSSDNLGRDVPVCQNGSAVLENLFGRLKLDSGVKQTVQSSSPGPGALGRKLRPEAPEFIPRDKSSTLNYAAALGGSSKTEESIASSELCPYYMEGTCWYGDQCELTHGITCDICFRAVLHPHQPQQCVEHIKECEKQLEKDMEESFAVARSQDKICGICMEHVLDKKGNSGSRRFGILANCKHVFCLSCIRTWRGSGTFENKIVRACPECRTVSDFVTPSSVWIDDEQAKKALIEDYQKALKSKDCKYFKKGEGECPFGNKCFYKHAKADGTLVECDSPRTVHKRLAQKRRTDQGESLSSDIIREYLLWQFLDERDNGGRERNDSADSSERAWILELALERELGGLDPRSDTDTSDNDLFYELSLL